MKSLAALLVLALLCAGCASPTEQASAPLVKSPAPAPSILTVPQLPSTPATGDDLKVVGHWHYDPASLNLKLDPKLEERIKKSKPGGQAAVDKLLKSFAANLARFKLDFGPNKDFFIAVPGSDKKLHGKWILKGVRLTVVMDNPQQPTPEMELDPSGKRIHTRYDQPNFGLGTIDLVRS